MGKNKTNEVKKGLLSFTGLVILFLILIMVNVIFSFANVRWDATEEKIYSLSDGTKKILQKLEVPVTVKFFFSRSNKNIPPNLKLYAKRVREFLSEYENASKGLIKVQLYDPKPDSDEEEWAQKYGIQPLQLGTGDKIFCGLVFLAEDQEATMPFLDPAKEELLEYEITRNIYRVQNTKKKVIGIVSGIPVFGAFDPRMGLKGKPWLFVTELKKIYDVREIPMSSDKISSDIDFLVVIHPKGISDKLQYAIDQYVLSGKNALVFVDPFCLSDVPQGQRSFMSPSSSSLTKLLKAWGIVMSPSKVVEDIDHSTALRTRDNRIEQNPLWLTIRKKSINNDNVVSSGLESLLFPVAAALEKETGSKYKFEPLVQTSKNSCLVDSFKANFGAQVARREFVASGKNYPLVVQVTGKFKTAFPDGPPSGKDGKKEAKSEEKKGNNQIKEAKEPVSVIVVGDADMLADRFYVQKTNLLGIIITKMFNDNLNFLANACEVLTGGQDLIGIRTRGRFERPFSTVIALRRKAQERWLVKEKELEKQVEETNKKLRELEKQKDASERLILSPEQEKEIAKFKEEKRRISKELKQVRKNLRADIESLGRKLKLINIFLMPFCVAIAGLIFAVYKQRKTGRK